MGKTSTAAAIALGMAARGGKVAVLTIDPARRLAHALGLDELGHEAHLVDAPVKGELWAMMLDPKRTFDELVEQHAPDERTRDSVLANPIYRELSNAVAGSQEYMAMEKLHELHARGRATTCWCSTRRPPATRSTSSTRRASWPRSSTRRRSSCSPGPGVLGLKLLGRGSGVLVGAMKRATGVDLLTDLSEFFRSFGGMVEGFRERAREVNALLADERSTFVVVTSPRAGLARRGGLLPPAAARGRAAVRGRGGQPRAHAGAGAPRRRGAEVEELLGAPLARKVVRTWDEERALAARDRAALRPAAHASRRRPD